MRSISKAILSLADNSGECVMKHRISSCVFAMAVVAAVHGNAAAQSLNYSDAVTVPQVDSKISKERDATKSRSGSARSGINWSNEPYDTRKQILPDPYSGTGNRGPDEYDPSVLQDRYRGKDGTWLYRDKQGNLYDSNGVRYGVVTKDGMIRELCWLEQQYDKRSNVNYAERAHDKEVQEYEKEMRKYEKNMKGIPESSWGNEGGHFDVDEGSSARPLIGGYPMPEKDEEDWAITPMTHQSAETKFKEQIEKAENEYLKDELFPDLEREKIDRLKKKADEVAALVDWPALERIVKKKVSILDECIASIMELEELAKKRDDLVKARARLFDKKSSVERTAAITSPQWNQITSQIDEVASQGKQCVSKINDQLLPTYNSLSKEFIDVSGKVDKAKGEVVNTLGKNLRGMEDLDRASRERELFATYLGVTLKSSRPISFSKALQELESRIECVKGKGLTVSPLPIDGFGV